MAVKSASGSIRRSVARRTFGYEQRATASAALQLGKSAPSVPLLGASANSVFPSRQHVQGRAKRQSTVERSARQWHTRRHRRIEYLLPDTSRNRQTPPHRPPLCRVPLLGASANSVFPSRQHVQGQAKRQSTVERSARQWHTDSLQTPNCSEAANCFRQDVPTSPM